MSTRRAWGLSPGDRRPGGGDQAPALRPTVHGPHGVDPTARPPHATADATTFDSGGLGISRMAGTESASTMVTIQSASR